MTTLNIRVDEKIKEAARKTFASMGLDMSSAVNLFLYQSVEQQRIPFEIKTVNGYSKEYESSILKEIRDIEKGIRSGKIKGYKNAKEMHQAILGKKAYAQYSRI